MTTTLIRHTVYGERDGRAFDDRETTAATLTIGSSPAADLRALAPGVAAAHATLAMTDRGVRLTTQRGELAVVNGAEVDRADLNIGDQLVIGNLTVAIITPPTGFDHALEVAQNDATRVPDLEVFYRTSLTATRLSKRALAWTLSAAVIALCFVVPLWLAPSADDAAATETSAAAVDTAWSTGPLHAAHEHAPGLVCKSCHAEPFVKVQDAACLACHETVAEHVDPTRLADRNQDPFRCGDCHKEHEEPARLVDSSGAHCADCHGFSRFASEHPAFSDYPHVGRTSILFDHNRHAAKHYAKTGKAFACSDCHALSADGGAMTLGAFAGMCIDCHGSKGGTRASVVFHHGDQVVTGDPVAFVTLPRLDTPQLDEDGGLRDWPEGTKRGSRAGLTRLGLTPISELLLATSQDQVAALSRLKAGRVKLASLRRATPEQKTAAIVVARGVKQLLADLAEDPESALATRLSALLGRPLPPRTLAALSGQLNSPMLLETIAAWFELTDPPTQASIWQALQVDPYEASASAAADAERPTSLPGVDWVRTGRWQTAKYSLQYEVAGHADDFVAAWIELAAELVTRHPVTTGAEFSVGHASAEVLEHFANVKATPGRATGPGRCSKCHARSVLPAGGPTRWQASIRERANTHTVFRHAPHLLADPTCEACHVAADDGQGKSSPFLDGYLEDRGSSEVAVTAEHTGNFRQMTLAECRQCHAADAAADDSCGTCHAYHGGRAAHRLPAFAEQ